MSHPPAPTPAAAKGEPVAYVYTTPISKGSYEHWLAVYQAFGVSRDVSHAALGFLITSDWLFGEASAMGLSVSESQVKRHLEEIEHKSYAKSGSFRNTSSAPTKPKLTCSPECTWNCSSPVSKRRSRAR